MTELGKVGKLAQANPPFTKADYFSGLPVNITHDYVIAHMPEIIELLAERGEFITAAEWREKRPMFGGGVQSLSERFSDTEGKIQIKNNFLCTEATRKLVPSESAVPTIPFPRKSKLEPATQDDQDRFWSHCHNGERAEAMMLWQNMNIDVNLGHSKDTSYTPLMVSATAGHKPIVEFLLQLGANPDAVHPSSSTALSMAMQMLSLNAWNDNGIPLAIADALQKKYWDNPAALVSALTRHSKPEPSPLDAAALLPDKTIHKVLTHMLDNAPSQRREAAGEDVLAPFGDKITREQLLAVQPGGNTLLGKAILNNMLRKALDMLHAAGERLSKDDLVSLDNGDTHLQHIISTGQMPVLFSPKYWVGHVREMQAVWTRVPGIRHTQMDGQEGRPSFKRMVQEANAASVQALRTSDRGIGD